MVWGMGDGGGREDLSCEVEGLLQSPLLQSAWVLAAVRAGKRKSETVDLSREGLG